MAGEAKSPKIEAGSMKFLGINLYYLANYGSYQSMKAVEPTYDQLASRNTCGAKMWYVLWGMLGWGIAVFPMILGGGNGSGWFLTMLGLVVYFSGFVLIYRH